MNSTDGDFAKKITAYLDQSTADLKAGTAYRLQRARAAALERLATGSPRTTAEPRLGHALAGMSGGAGGNAGSHGGRSIWSNTRTWVGIVLIAAAGFGYQQWRVYQQVHEFEEIDAQILTSDLPLDAYLDRGFQTWLTSHDD